MEHGEPPLIINMHRLTYIMLSDSVSDEVVITVIIA